MLTENALVKGGWRGLFLIWFSTRPLDYLPLTLTSFWLEWHWWGPNPLGYHVTNVLLHASGALVLWRVLRHLKIPGAWTAALIFAVHPVCVASVAWVAERKNTLSLVFYSLSLLFFLRSNQTTGPRSDHSESRTQASRSYWLSLLAFVLALLSKSSVVILPLILLLCLWWLRASPPHALTRSFAHPFTSRDLLRFAPFFALSLLFSVIAVWFQYERGLADAPGASPPFVSRVLGGGLALWFYLYKTFLPINLSMIYPRWQLDPASWLSYLPGALWLTTLGLCWRFREAWGRPCGFGLGYFFVALSPALGFLKMSFHQYSQVADHFQYLALIGPIALAVSTACSVAFLPAQAELQPCPKPTPLARHASLVRGFVQPLGFVLIALLCVLTWRQAALYQGPSTLWRDTLARNPRAWIACHNLAAALYQRGETEEAILYYRKALELNPSYAPAESNLGYAFATLGRMDEAITHCKKAVRLQPAFAPAHNNLGIVLSRQGDAEAAIAEFRAAVALDPESAEAYHNWGAVLARQGKFQDALGPLSSALRLNPDYADARMNLALTHYQVGLALDRELKTAEALAHWRQALLLEKDLPEVLNALAWTLATHPDPNLRNGPEAVQCAQRASALTGEASCFDTLAAAYAEAGRFPEAIRMGEKALALLDPARTNTAVNFRARLELYRQGRAYRQP